MCVFVYVCVCVFVYLYLYLYLYAAVSTGKRKTEAQETFLNPPTAKRTYTSAEKLLFLKMRKEG
jgi:hypothetical protein